MIILCFVVTDSLQGFILFWIFTFNKRVFDLYRRLGQRLEVRSLARQEERQRLRLKAAMVRQQSQSQSLTVADLDLQTNKLTNMMAWLARSRKESGASEVSTSTQATTVKAVSGRWDTLTEEYEDRLSGLDQVTRAFVSLSHHHTITPSHHQPHVVYQRSSDYCSNTCWWLVCTYWRIERGRV